MPSNRHDYLKQLVISSKDVQMMKYSKGGQSGFTLIEMLVVISLMSLAMVQYALWVDDQANEIAAKRLGVEISQLSHAVASAVFHEEASIATGTTTYTGSPTAWRWLQPSGTPPTGCGGNFPAADAYLNCRFNDNMAALFNSNYTVTLNKDSVTQEIVATVSVGPIQLRGVTRPDLGGAAIAAAESAYAALTLGGAGDGTDNFFMDYSNNIDTTAGGFGVVTVTIDTNASGAGASPFLRLSGADQMLGDLDMGDGTHDINNANNIFWGGASTDSGLINSGGTAGIRMTDVGGAGGGSYIEFYRASGVGPPEVLIVNDAAGRLTVQADAIDLDALDVSVTGRLAATDVIETHRMRSLNQAVTDVFIATPGAVIDKPQCILPSEPTIYVSVAAMAGISESEWSSGIRDLKNLNAFEARAVDNNPLLSWTVELVGIKEGGTGTFTPPAELGKLMVVVKCS